MVVDLTHLLFQLDLGTFSWNSVTMESFFASLQREIIHRQACENREEAKIIMFEYVKFFYKTERINSSLGYLTHGERMNEPSTTQTVVHISWGSP